MRFVFCGKHSLIEPFEKQWDTQNHVRIGEFNYMKSRTGGKLFDFRSFVEFFPSVLFDSILGPA